VFGRYGRLAACDVKPGRDRMPAFAFIEFNSARDAQDAIRGEDQRTFGGMRMRVEESKGGRVAREAGRGPPNRTGFRVRILGLPASASWQDLKDHMRTAGDVGFADVTKDAAGVPVGIVEYRSQGDMDEALSRLNNSDFVNRFGDKAVLTVEADGAPRAGAGGRDEGRGREERGGAGGPPQYEERGREEERGRGEGRGGEGGERERERSRSR